MIVAWALTREPRWARYAAMPGLWLVVFLITWEGLCLLNGGDLMQVTALQLRPVSALLVPVALVAAALAFAGVLGGRGFFCVILRSAPLQLLGSISYSLYLWHPIMMSMIKHAMYVRHLPDHVGPYAQAVFLGLSLPSSCAVAWVSQRVLEKRVTVWLRRRLEGGVRRRSAIQPPVTTTHAPVVRALMDVNGP